MSLLEGFPSLVGTDSVCAYILCAYIVIALTILVIAVRIALIITLHLLLIATIIDKTPSQPPQEEERGNVFKLLIIRPPPLIPTRGEEMNVSD